MIRTISDANSQNCLLKKALLVAWTPK